MAIDVLMVGREAVTLAWTMHRDAFGYLVRRVTRDDDGVQTDVLRAVVYEGMYCDPALSPDREYLYEISSIPDPDAAEQPDEPMDRQRVRVRTRPELEYPGVRAFFTDFIAPTFRRRVDSRGARWCPEWFAHPEVLFAITELWNAYEAMRPPEPPLPPGKSRAEWLTVFAWPFLDRLTSQDGPLKDCYPTPEDGDGRCHIPMAEAKMRALPDTPALS